MADYDNAEVTKRERQAADNLKNIARYNADATRNQLTQQLGNYDFANRQNRALADVELKQNKRKSETDRFEAQRDLQNAALGLMGSMNQAMNGSSIGNLMSMLENRNDKENNTYWQQLQTNQNTVNNAYDESFNQNQVAKRDATINAEKALKDMQGDLAANLNNINPTLFSTPGEGESDLGAKGFADKNSVAEHNAVLSGYLQPDNAGPAAQAKRNRLGGTDYYSRLINSFNGMR